MSKTSAKIIADTVHPRVPSARITTLEVYAPRFLLAEVNTHGVLSKSAASSRAIPVRKRIEMVEDHGFIPTVFGKNKRGMQADEVVQDQDGVRDLWQMGMGYAIGIAEALEKSDVHKQLANRVLEPYAYYHGVITATEWDNFYRLRLHPDAQPEFVELAQAMRTAMDESPFRIGCEHLPYVDSDDEIMTMWRRGTITAAQLFQISAARCARVSYKTHDGKPFNLEADLALCDQLIKGGHMSPFEHAARADEVWNVDGVRRWESPVLHRKFWGWIPDRVLVERENNVPPGRRDSFAPVL